MAPFVRGPLDDGKKNMEWEQCRYSASAYATCACQILSGSIYISRHIIGVAFVWKMYCFLAMMNGLFVGDVSVFVCV